MNYAFLPLLITMLVACQPSTKTEEQSEMEPTPDSIPEQQANTTDTTERLPAPALPPIDYDSSAWTEVTRLDNSIILDLRYATANNFVEEQMYECGRCFLRPAVAKAVVAVHHRLQKLGLGLKLYDCYRPRPIQWKLWEKVPDPRYVSNPRKGSMHNRGAAVDLTLVDSTGRELPMGTPYDFFGREAHPAYQDLPDSILHNRLLLSQLMKAHGFKPIRTEWWHFSLSDRPYELSDMLWKCY